VVTDRTEFGCLMVEQCSMVTVSDPGNGGWLRAAAKNDHSGRSKTRAFMAILQITE